MRFIEKIKKLFSPKVKANQFRINNTFESVKIDDERIEKYIQAIILENKQLNLKVNRYKDLTVNLLDLCERQDKFIGNLILESKSIRYERDISNFKLRMKKETSDFKIRIDEIDSKVSNTEIKHTSIVKYA